ncbi:putative lysozyme-like protein isoform X2 [Dicentrarchus labrax]|uniref:putative lysozyme-like protein isoform X2 n=1 Tax=Dicentrarchus labrax TaxID=13489 RepID=UPI0021F5435A|nr:putative lysozyme-like protein isoform X2 [Dicentrarchus labrax]
MLPPNLLILSMVVFLATTVSTAPVEEKEQEELEVEATEEVEGELSEEEEDDDDSKSQDKIDEGVVGVQQTTTAAAAASGGSGILSNIQDLSASSSQSAGGGANDGTAGSSAGHAGDSSSVDSSAAGGPSSSAASQPAGSSGSPAAAVELSGVSQTQPAGSDGLDSESNGNGQKLLNGGGGGGGGGGADSQTGTIDPSSNDFLLGLMETQQYHHEQDLGDKGKEKLPVKRQKPRTDPSALGHMALPTQLDATVISSGLTAAPSADQNSGSSLDSPADPAHHFDISIDQSGPDHTSLSSGPDQSQSSSVSGSSHSAALGADGADSPDAHGNGRQTLLMDSNAVTDRLVSFNDLQTQNLQIDLTDVMVMSSDGADSVTGLHIDLTASGLGLSHDVTESSPVVLHSQSVDAFTHTLRPGGYSFTDLVTVATDSTGTDTVSADPTRSPLDSTVFPSGHPAVTAHTQTAGTVTEQYNPSGQGPEGAENVELEDTC